MTKPPPKIVDPRKALPAPAGPPSAVPKTSSWPKGWRRPKVGLDWAVQACYTLGYLAMLFLWLPDNMLMVWAGGVFALGGVVLTEFAARCENRRAVHTVQAVLWAIFFILSIRENNRRRSRDRCNLDHAWLLQQRPPQRGGVEGGPMVYEPLRYGDRR